MVEITAVIIGGVFAMVGLWAAHRLTVVANAALALRGTPTNDRTHPTEGQTVAIEGRVFVDEPASAAERLFDRSVDTVGAYIWQAWFADAGRYTYDFDRGELRQGRNTFASGLETGRFGVTTSGQNLYLDLSWYDQVYDTTALSELEVGNPKSNTRLPPMVTRYVSDGMYISLDSTICDCSIDKLTDIVELYRDDVETDEFTVESRGITAGQQLFVLGEVRVQDGELTVAGTDRTPLLVADGGRESLTQQLWWRGIGYALVLPAAVGLGAVFVL